MWSSTAPMEGLFNDDDLELIETAQMLRQSRSNITGKKVFLGWDKAAYMNMRP